MSSGKELIELLGETLKNMALQDQVIIVLVLAAPVIVVAIIYDYKFRLGCLSRRKRPTKKY